MTRRRGSRSPRYPADGRAEAHRILCRVESGGAYAAILLRSLPESLEPRDRALATELVLGTLRWQGRLDFAVGQFAEKPVDQLDPPVRIALRLGAYQILHLSRIPASAAVNESVRLARRAAGRGGGGFVNAVLRRLAAGPVSWPREADPVRRLSIEQSHPEWLVRRWVARLGEEEAEQALAADNRPAPLTLRANRRAGDRDDLQSRLAAEGIRTQPGRWAPWALRAESGAVASTRAFREGRCYIQDEASQIVAALAEGEPGARVADLCAGPGGKATCLAEASGESGLVVASDRSPVRLGLVRKNAGRMDLRLAGLVQDAARPALRQGTFHRVLLDAPCSGTGVLRRQPEVRWRRGEEDIERLAELQGRLLDAALPLLGPGGLLVYSVCSVEPEEGPRAVGALLERRPDVELVDPTGLSAPPPAEMVSNDGPGPHLRTVPHRHDVDGFFAAVLRLRPAG